MNVGAVPSDPASGPAIVMHGQSRNASTFKQIGIEVNVLPPVPAPPEVRYSLPPDTPAFIGRDEELSQITMAAEAGGVVAVRAIDGMPGVGKTALAVHAAHVMRDRYPDWNFFIDLHAHTPGRDPVRPEDALAGLLAATGVDPRYLPGDLDGRAGMWRDKMAGQRALLVLDNAASSGQVTPLLPGSEGCLVLITSRRHLGDLPGVATPVLLAAMPPQRAQEMFLRLAPRASDSTVEVAEIVELAGFLPLAISLLARLFARHRSWTLADLASETRERLLTLTAEHDSVAAAFDVSYRHLDPAQQQFFRLLGLHPGTTSDSYAAAALAGTSPEEAARLLDELHGEGLLTETGYRRYGMHDLLRRYAVNFAAAYPGEDGQQAVNRLLDYYQHAAAWADASLTRYTRPGPGPGAIAVPYTVPAMDEADQALGWARTERANLLACLDRCAGTSQHTRVVALTAALAALLQRDGPWADAITRHTTAIHAARSVGDRLGEANALIELGIVQRMTSDYLAAAQCLEQAVAAYRDLGERLGEGNALNNLGIVRWLTSDYQAAAQVLEQSLRIYRDLGNRLGEAHALTNLGGLRVLVGDYQAAAQALEQSLEIYRDLGDRLGEGNALCNLGDAQRLTGDYLAAAQVLEQALAIHRDLGNRHGEAYALTSLGRIRRLVRDYMTAAQVLERALAICGDLGDRGGEATALNERGTLYRVSGDLVRAEKCHQKALETARAIATSQEEAQALAGLGRCAVATGDATQAESLLRQAHAIFQHIGAAETLTVLAELDAAAVHPSKAKP